MSIEDELAKRNMAKHAAAIKENQRVRAEKDAKKLLHNSVNVSSYTPMSILSGNIQQQLVAKKLAMEGLAKDAPQANPVMSFDLQNAMANLRAHKGIEAPQFAGETEYVPTIEDALAGLEEEPVEETREVEPEGPAPRFNTMDLARQLLANMPLDKNEKKKSPRKM